MSDQGPGGQPRGRRNRWTWSLLASLSFLVTASTLLWAAGPDDRNVGDDEPQNPAGSLPDTVEACQEMFDGKNDATWRAADGNVSVALPGGRVAWLFGDTHREGAPFIHNSILVQEGDRLTSTTGGQAIPNDGDGSYYWPTDGLVDGGLLRVFLNRVAQIGDVGRGFENRGVAMATFGFDSREFPVYQRKQNITRMNEDTAVQWGTAVVRDGGYVYLYGQRRRPGEWVFGRDVYVAQVPAGAVAVLSAWRFWTGSDWVAEEDLAAPIESAESGRFASNFSVDKVGDTWVAVSKHSDIAGDRIIEMRSPGPLGPFVTTSSIAAPSTSQRWTYQARAHPELPLEDGRTLVTWNVGAARPKLMPEDFAKPRCGAH